MSPLDQYVVVAGVLGAALVNVRDGGVYWNANVTVEECVKAPSGINHGNRQAFLPPHTHLFINSRFCCRTTARGHRIVSLSVDSKNDVARALVRSPGRCAMAGAHLGRWA